MSGYFLPLLIVGMCTSSSEREFAIVSQKRGVAWFGSVDAVDAARL